MSILAIQPGAIGDLVLSLPALRRLRSAAGPGGMEIWCERNGLALVEHPAYCGRARPLAETGLDSYPLPARTLEAMKAFDVVISWRGAGQPELVSAVTAAHQRAVFLPPFPQPATGVHLADFRQAQVAQAFPPVREFPATSHDFPLLAADEQFADACLLESIGGGPLVVLHPGASGARKRWDAAAFAAVAEHLHSRWAARILLSEGPLDAQAVAAVRSAAPRIAMRGLAVANLRHLAAVLARAGLFIGNDTGIAHLAAAAGAPVLAVFQNTDPRLWTPRGRAVRVLERPSPGAVIAAADTMLDSLRKGSSFHAADQRDSRPESPA